MMLVNVQFSESGFASCAGMLHAKCVQRVQSLKAQAQPRTAFMLSIAIARLKVKC